MNLKMALTAIALGATSIAGAQTQTLRLVYPQWQGADVSALIKEVPDADVAARGYYLGAHLLNFLAPDSGQKTVVVPVSTDTTERIITDGLLDRDILSLQTKAALDILEIENPAKIATLGGECSVSVVPFTYLAAKYPDDVAVIWIDAHPDITLPGDVYPAYHAMALTAIMGDGNEKVIGQLPAKIDPSKILCVGLRDWERDEIKQRQKEYGIKHLMPAETRENSNAVIEWLNQCGASKVMIHFDMDVLDPTEIIPAVGIVPDGMKIAEVVRVINDIAEAKDLVALTIAEPMPRTALLLQQMLNKLPLLK